ncbi:MAG: hypothetical protein IT410_03945 [Candidatus Doudnabacteria bacterium]|nr:hypothetical protein [Candidatus Doudnabacteria bacterium]
MVAYSPQEIKLFKKLNSPAKIQDYLNTLKHNKKDTWRSPRNVIKHKEAYCIEGAILAAAILEFHGHKPLIMDIRGAHPDVDHVIAPFKLNGYWGAISKTNYAVLRYREPIYKTLRELVMSYFHEYFLDNGIKTLRDYSVPLNLRKFKKYNWQTSEQSLEDIAEYIDTIKHIPIINKKQIKNLRKADSLEIAVGKLREWPKKR